MANDPSSTPAPAAAAEKPATPATDAPATPAAETPAPGAPALTGTTAPAAGQGGAGGYQGGGGGRGPGGPGGRGRGGQGGGRGRGGQGGRRNQRDRNNQRDEAPSDHVEKVVFINRCAKVVKGGRRFSFSALMVVGDQKGKVGVGFGKANEVSECIRKATEDARKKLEPISLREHTIPHDVTGEFGGGHVLLRPASEGTGIIAGGAVRAIIEAVGIKDVLGKSLGSGNPANVLKATMDALRQLRTRQEIYELRGRKYHKPEAKVDATKKDAPKKEAKAEKADKEAAAK